MKSNHSNNPHLGAPVNGDKIHISFNYLKEISGGDKEFEKEIIDLYLKQSPARITNLKDAVQKKNYDSIQFQSHKLRSSFSLMGINENGLLERLEESARTHAEIEKIEADFIQLKRIYDHTFVAITEVQSNL